MENIVITSTYYIEKIVIKRSYCIGLKKEAPKTSLIILFSFRVIVVVNSHG